MTLPVHWVPSLVDAAVGSTVEVTGDEAHHAVAVRRLRVGESVVLTDGRRPVRHRARGESRGSGRSRWRSRRWSTPLAPEPARHGRPGDPQGRPRRAGRRGADRGGRRAGRALGCLAVASRSGRASGPRSPWRGGARRPARPPSRRGDRGSPGSRPMATTAEVVALVAVRRPRRRAARGGRLRRWPVLRRARRLVRSWWSSAPRAVSATRRSQRSRPPARTPYVSGPRCCAPRPPAWLRWPRCCRGRRAGARRRSSPRAPRSRNVMPRLAWMLTNSVWPSGENVDPANSSPNRGAPVRADQAVEGDVPQLAAAGQPADVVVDRAVLADHERAVGAGGDVVGEVEAEVRPPRRRRAPGRGPAASANGSGRPTPGRCPCRTR